MALQGNPRAELEVLAKLCKNNLGVNSDMFNSVWQMSDFGGSHDFQYLRISPLKPVYKMKVPILLYWKELNLDQPCVLVFCLELKSFIDVVIVLPVESSHNKRDLTCVVQPL